MRASSLCGVILAAGASSRMGRDKALLPWPPNVAGSTFLSDHIERLRPFTELVIVVAGGNANRIAPVVNAAGAFLALNPDPDRGQFSSLQIGLQEVLNRGRDAAMIALVDRPSASVSTLRNLRDTFLNSDPQQTWAVVPEHGGHHGHPFVVAREMIECFLRAPLSSTARDVEYGAQNHILYLPIEDSAISTNVNTPEQYQALCESYGSLPQPLS